MPSKPASPPIPDIDAMMELVGRFEAAQAREPALAEAELDEVIRMIHGKRALFSGAYAGRDAIFRFYLDRPEAHAARDWAELERTRGYMTEGDLRAHEGLYHNAALGLVVSTKEQGTPLLQHIWRSEPDARTTYLEPAAQWLRKFTAPTETREPARVEAWLERAAACAERQPFAELRPLEAAILAEMERISAPLKEAEWRVATCHGDFHPNNLLVDGARLTAIDIGGSARLPIYKDMARFLAHIGRRGVRLSGARRFGVDAVGFDAFAQVFALDEAERQVWLPFAIGVEALIRVESKGLKPARIQRAKSFFRALLTDLRALPG